jgi:long-chain acyl-CoA synthetase
MADNSTIRDLVVSSLHSYPDATASAFVDGASWTFAEIGDVIAGLCDFFRERGVVPGDRIALLSENQPAWAPVYLAAVCYGAVVVPILPDFSGDDVASILEHSESRLVFASKRQMEKLQILGDSGKKIPEIRQVDAVLEDYLEDGSAGPTEISPKERAGRVLAAMEKYAAPGPDDTAAIIYTSGTTGHSKGVELSHHNIASNVESADHFAHMKRGEQMLSILPLAHTYECTLGMLIPFSRGAQVNYLSRPASPSVLMKAMQSVQPHLMLAVPLLIEKIVRGRVVPQLEKGAVRRLRKVPILRKLIYRKARKKLVAAFGGRLRFFGIGGAPLSADVEQVLYALKFPYAIGYGLTETAPLLAGTSPFTNWPRSTGVPTPGVEIRIQDGEIQARGPNIMKGYYRDPERTAEVFTDDGWFRTGDLGSFDGQGRLYVQGRSKTVILGSSGENIYPEAIESVINQFSGVEESLVLQEGSRLVARVKVDYENLTEGAKNMAHSAARRAGEAVEAAAEAAGHAGDHAKTFLDDLRKKVNDRLSSFSRISEIREQDEPFAKTPTSKIKRYLYQEGETPPPGEEETEQEHGDTPSDTKSDTKG